MNPECHAHISRGAIVIRVRMKTLPVAFSASPSNPTTDEGDPKYRITDLEAFAANVCRRLNEEEEDGTTLIHRAFNAAFEQVLEQGDEGVNLEGE